MVLFRTVCKGPIEVLGVFVGYHIGRVVIACRPTAAAALRIKRRTEPLLEFNFELARFDLSTRVNPMLHTWTVQLRSRDDLAYAAACRQGATKGIINKRNS
jgi:hypothetical protein